ncbi:hypothetical protein OPV22_003220 [Ensete ventricosum]|uniref:Uncharacterized protein n=1 Tax=Ensete ventricosum TaxID=4639 RepID=A0AAV8S088_ENSVE|nr:hypothetical protein OPV22_003220 [Ensete ventricosum]
MNVIIGSLVAGSTNQAISSYAPGCEDSDRENRDDAKVDLSWHFLRAAVASVRGGATPRTRRSPVVCFQMRGLPTGGTAISQTSTSTAAS